MKRLLQINITANWGSHGKIAEGIGHMVLARGWESHIAYGRWANPSESQLYRIGSSMDEVVHGVGSRLFDNHGLMSRGATRRLVRYIDALQPDIIHLHNIHGYYLNYPLLFAYLAARGTPVVWTLHDCWSFTGHCAHYMFVGCRQWETHCRHCLQPNAYPKSLWADRSYRNFEKKRAAFLSVPRLTLVPVSRWLEGELQRSFFGRTPIRRIYNGIDVDVFRPQGHTEQIRAKYGISADRKIVLGVASNWYRKGLDDFVRLAPLLPSESCIVLVGLNEKEMRMAEKAGIVGIRRTDDTAELAALYSTADVYFNPTWEETFGLTNLEAMACGTPAITYRTGGSAETIGPGTGCVVEKGDVLDAAEKIREILLKPAADVSDVCRWHVLERFDKHERFSAYYDLYTELLSRL